MKTLTAITLAAALAAAACSEEPAREVSREVSDQLPADVADLAPATPAATPAVTEGEPGAAPASPMATEAGPLTATGELVSPSRSEVAPKVPGRVAAVYVDEGARVGRGQPLFALETTYPKLEVERAEAELARARAAEEQARRDFDRKKGLREKDSIPQASFDTSQGAYEQAQAARTAAEAGLAMARQRVADSVIRSPLTGVVAERRTDVGEHLGEAGVAFVVVQTSPLKLRFSVPERYLGKLKTGQTVTARVDPYPGEAFTGRITTVGGVIDPATRTLFAEAELPNRDGRLTPGLFARVEAALD